MPRLPGLEFVDGGGLSVRYRASESPQELVFRMVFEKTTDVLRMAELRGFKWRAEEGFSGSDLFPPEAAEVEILDMPDTIKSRGKKHELAFRVANIAPITLRRMVERLRFVGSPVKLASLDIEGELPLDDGPSSVDTAKMRAWLDDRKAFIQAWPKVPFKVTSAPSEEVGWRVVLEGELTPAAREGLGVRATSWPNMWSYDEVGEPVNLNNRGMLPGKFAAKQEFSARYRAFPWDRKAMRGALVNSFVAFHHKIAPIKLVELTL